ncbi:hypothetical protein MtrunA17_Chr7g0222581 [Medicago truncatula]|uniref:Uncharacterized protein n=1 Tax=Medicago truncatula TaxID=3880 RepID=A0A396GUB6_MEDTR|nr:hypothetical protein MtrunA17_Chr7g0222581 [Medicago truncatula]
MHTKTEQQNRVLNNIFSYPFACFVQSRETHALPSEPSSWSYYMRVRTVVLAFHINGSLVPLLKDAGALWL